MPPREFTLTMHSMWRGDNTCRVCNTELKIGDKIISKKVAQRNAGVHTKRYCVRCAKQKLLID